MEQFISAGCIICNNKILLVKQRRKNKWSLPKGKSREGETEFDTLVREVKEETSLFPSVLNISEVKEFSYISKFGNIKNVILYFIRLPHIPKEVLEFSSKEIEQVSLFEFEEGLDKINKHYKQNILKWAL